MTRSSPLVFFARLILAFVTLAPAAAQQQALPVSRVLDTMDDPATWKVVTPEGVRLSVHQDEGVEGMCTRLDYEFVTGGGYCIIQKDLPVTLPPNYEFAFHVRGTGPDNNLEFKLLDKQGDSVWWVNRRAYEWPAAWTRLSNKKRKLEFAWGPSAGAPLTEISKIEFAIASSSGGKGSVWLDELTLRELGDAPLAQPRIHAIATSDTSANASKAPRMADANPLTAWRMPDDAAQCFVEVDLGEVTEFSALDIDWAGRIDTFDVELSDDRGSWTKVLTKLVPSGRNSIHLLPESQARYISLTLRAAVDGKMRPGIGELRVRPAQFGESPTSALTVLAKESRRGTYPRFLLGEASYWTVIGTDSDKEEALISEDGAIEVGPRLFSIEPVLTDRAEVLTWAHARTTQSLRGSEALVRREHKSCALTVSAKPLRVNNTPWLIATYTLEALQDVPDKSCSLRLLPRPIQVNPSYQFLSNPGGAGSIQEVGALADRTRIVTRRTHRDIFSSPTPATRAASPFQRGDEFFELGVVTCTLGVGQSVSDSTGLASGCLAYRVPALRGGETFEVLLAIPLRDGDYDLPVPMAQLRTWLATQGDATKAETHHAPPTRVHVPTSDRWIADTFAAQLAYILINRDGPALQPGSRSYERSWARDGSLTSAALLSCGHTEEARAWIDWFGSHQFDNGKIPCVVDSRGPDPVNEHDSNGEYIWAVANDYRHTRDTEFLRAHYPRVQKTVQYIESLRAERRTPEYQDESSPKRAMYGLVPESISHEGYSAKPMHSYWDDFFILLGLKEAAYIAEQLGDDEWAQAYAKYAVEFRGCLYDSMRRVFAEKNINYIPGCVELGDFDSTSTTIALFPCDEQDHAPRAQLRNTFDRYWTFAKGRMNGEPWEAFTPYELRHVGAFIRLQQPQRAYELLQWFHQFQRPQGWHHWAEVVWHDPKTPKFIGDMPHTWVGSDYLNSVLSMFAYDQAETLVLFAGVPREWTETEENIGIENLHTRFGTLTLSMQRRGKTMTARVTGDAVPPEAGFIVRKPPGTVGEDATIRTLPAEVSWALE